ncbi:MAG: ubiquinone/menaquinone biosynthesis methyltransferase [Coriobacteriales bacterium]|jgi:demethylmenaquinone methyltransferase/2-methoxy-6-polyprenyl-1,4-benzoquinol methylase|nr:ubiquinone/menaquinone biosynthesis methyltransferase [Coriobacteriales bacterium]
MAAAVDSGLATSPDAQAVFSRIAEQYDRFNAVSSLGIYRHWLRVLVDEAEKAVDQRRSVQPPRVLDLAGGTGEVAFALVRRMSDIQVVLSDFCRPMLDVAAERCRAGVITRAQAGRIQFVQADARQLPFADASFSALTCAYGIRNIPERDRALAEAFRVLEPGGSLLICEFSTPPAAAWRRLYHLYLQTMIPLLGGLLTGERAEFHYLRDSIRAFPHQRAFCEMLLAAGFADISYRNLTGGIVALHKAVKR